MFWNLLIGILIVSVILIIRFLKKNYIKKDDGTLIKAPLEYNQLSYQEKISTLLELLDKAEKLSYQFSGSYSNNFISAQEFSRALSESITKLKEGDKNQIDSLYNWFSPTCDWDDIIGKEGEELANNIFELLSQLREFKNQIETNHIEFINKVLEVFNDVLSSYNFTLFRKEVQAFGCEIIWIKNKSYINIFLNTHPHDAPKHFGILLGEFKGDTYKYDEDECIGLWQIKLKKDNSEARNKNHKTLKKGFKTELFKEKEDLLKYAQEFLNGNLDDFNMIKDR